MYECFVSLPISWFCAQSYSSFHLFVCNHKLVKSHLKGQNDHKGPSIVKANSLSKNDVELTNLFGVDLLHIYNKL